MISTWWVIDCIKIFKYLYCDIFNSVAEGALCSKLQTHLIIFQLQFWVHRLQL